MNGAPQSVWVETCRDLRTNPHSLIPKLPDFTYPPYYGKFVDMIVHDNMVWQMGLTTSMCSIAEIKNATKTPTGEKVPYKHDSFRCICPLSIVLKKWHASCGLSDFFEHGGIPLCSEKIFQNPNDLIDHVVHHGKDCILHFLTGRVIKLIYEKEL